MPPISPPLAGAECLEMQGQAEGSSSARRAKRQVIHVAHEFSCFSYNMNDLCLSKSFTKQSALDTDATHDDGSTANGNGNNTTGHSGSTSSDDDGSTLVSTLSESTTSLTSDASSIDPASTQLMKELPWMPKVR
jgi:hypothetical protein